MNFKNEVVVITGAGSGMGRAYALEFAKRGTKLALNDFNKTSLLETLSLIRELSDGQTLGEAFDVSDLDAMRGFAAQVKATLGNASIVINNAGVSDARAATVWEAHDDDIARTLNINLNGVINGTRAFLPQLLELNRGSIINVSSVFGLVGVPLSAFYCASKFAVRGFSEALMAELYDSPIEVLIVHPGGIATNISQGVEGGGEFADTFLTTPPEDIAKKVISKIGKGSGRVIFGNQAWRVYLASKIYPLFMRSRILFNKIMPMKRGK